MLCGGLVGFSSFFSDKGVKLAGSWRVEAVGDLVCCCLSVLSFRLPARFCLFVCLSVDNTELFFGSQESTTKKRYLLEERWLSVCRIQPLRLAVEYLSPHLFF